MKPDTKSRQNAAPHGGESPFTGDLTADWFDLITKRAKDQLLPALALHEDASLTFFMFALEGGGESLHNQVLQTIHMQIELSHLPEPTADQPAAREMFAQVEKDRPKSPIVEVIFGIEMYSLPGQGIEFEDFLAVYHWRKDEIWRHGVLDFRFEPEPAIVRPIRWDHPIWAARLRRQHQLWAQKERGMLMGLKLVLDDGRSVWAAPGFEGLRVPEGQRETWDVKMDSDKRGGRIYAISDAKLDEAAAYVDYVNTAESGCALRFFGRTAAPQEAEKLRRYSVGFHATNGNADETSAAPPKAETDGNGERDDK